MRADLVSSLRLAAVTIAICAVAYPLAIVAAARFVAPNSRLGSLVTNEQGQVVGSRLIAQGFSRPEYFWSRPSACEYDASAAGGSNLSPASPAIRKRAKHIIALLGLPGDRAVPADLVTASGGGLDPHISYRAAAVQVRRVAEARALSENEILRLVDKYAEEIPLTTARVKIVNVLELNIALDHVASSNRSHE